MREEVGGRAIRRYGMCSLICTRDEGRGTGERAEEEEEEMEQMKMGTKVRVWRGKGPGWHEYTYRVEWSQ